jgi:tryptophan 2,3-dioxygenase
MTLTYSTYLELDELLSLQKLRSPERAHDEMLFIIIHQIYELWFKEILHEIDYLVKALESSDLPRAQFALKRILSVLKVLIEQLDVLETMSSAQFCSFRDSLGSASGFQSAQFRELEFLLGNKSSEALLSFPNDHEGRSRLDERLKSGTVWDAFLSFLDRNNWPVSEESLPQDCTQLRSRSESVQAALMKIYATESALSFFCEMLLDLDEKFQEWRYRHVKMVERIIGARQGTGGSSGVEYLKTTLFKPSFPDLWAIRSNFKKHD